jgi:uncharacterized protein (TIGR02646 family)
MIKVEKDFTDLPTILTKKLREDAFDANVASSSYCDNNNRYKVGSVQKRLNEIYHLKCAYCEQKLLDAPKHIEHYRPKDTYYWLAYSWDNLLLCCSACNSAKGDRFAIKNSVVTYSNEAFCDIHSLGSNYDTLEEPQIINPEKDDVLDLIVFDSKGKISSSNSRVQHTIEDACNLNRNELVQLRLEIVNDFIQRVNEHYLYFQKEGNITRFIPDIQNFIKNCKVENEFYSFRYFVLKNANIFFNNNIGLEKIVCSLFEKYNDH